MTSPVRTSSSLLWSFSTTPSSSAPFPQNQLEGKNLQILFKCLINRFVLCRDCLDNVSQRLGLQQPDLFGLKYVSRRSYPKIRWVDLERPLKKQLDKYSTEPYLFLGVIFYVTDVSLLEDEITRYHYFLQLKMDVVEGRLRCNHEQAIVLASYSLQAEFGDHDPEKHTAEYLKDFPLLPKPMVDQFEDRMGARTDAVVMPHSSLLVSIYCHSVKKSYLPQKCSNLKK